MVTWRLLKAAIEKSGKTPVDFAHSIGVSAVTIGMVKAGRPISSSSVKKLQRAIEEGGVEHEDL